MEIDQIRDCAMWLRWAGDAMRDAAVMLEAGVPADNGRLKDALHFARVRLSVAGEKMGFTVTPIPSPDQAAHERMLAIRKAEGCQEAELYQGAPIEAGPDDGLQHDERGHLVGGR